MRKIAVFLGCIEALALLVFAASIVVNAKRDHSTVGSPAVQAIIFRYSHWHSLEFRLPITKDKRGRERRIYCSKFLLE
ncbi:MAG: hypothetical protein WCO64_07870 [Actinomycetes bacterium]